MSQGPYNISFYVIIASIANTIHLDLIANNIFSVN